MNYIFAFIAFILIVFAAKFLSSPPQKPEMKEPSSSAAIENLFSPSENDASQRIKEMRDKQDRIQQQQKDLQRERLDSYKPR